MLDHTAKIRIILGPNLKFALKENYEEDIYQKLKYKERIIEIKKDVIFKKDCKLQYIIVIATPAEREHADNDLQKMKWDGGNGAKYISFQNSTSDTRLGALHINSMNNVEVKYEYITNVNLSEEVEH